MDRGKMSPLVKLLTFKYYNCEAFKATMQRVWHPVKSVRFHDMDEGLMMAKFEMHIKIRVWDDPWNFDKSFILVKDFEGSQQVKIIKMENASFWIRVYDLPLMA